MKGDESKFEQMSYGETRALMPEAYTTPGAVKQKLGKW